MLDTGDMFLKFEDDDVFEYGIKDIREILTKFKKNKKASLKDIALLNTISSYLLSNAITKMGEEGTSLFLEYDEDDLLDTCIEYRVMCQLLENPDAITSEIIESDSDEGFLH